jgi:hypothetical protein
MSLFQQDIVQELDTNVRSNSQIANTFYWIQWRTK